MLHLSSRVFTCIMDPDSCNSLSNDLGSFILVIKMPTFSTNSFRLSNKETVPEIIFLPPVCYLEQPTNWN